MCEMPYLLWSLSVLKHRMKKWGSISRNVVCVIFFWLLELPRQRAWHLKKYLSEEFSLFIYWLLSKAWQCIDLGGKALAQRVVESPSDTPASSCSQCCFDCATFSVIFSLLSWPRVHLGNFSWMDIFFQIFIQSHSSFSAHLLRSLLWEKVCRHWVMSDTLYGVVDVCADYTHSEHPAAVEALSSSPG